MCKKLYFVNVCSSMIRNNDFVMNLYLFVVLTKIKSKSNSDHNNIPWYIAK